MPPKQKKTEDSSALNEFGSTKKQRPMMAELYRQASARLRKRKVDKPEAAEEGNASLDPQKLLHEVQVHQMELEMQNTELQESRNRMEVLLEKYTDLYDFAPVGYFTLSANGTIRQANLTGAVLFGVERASLVGRLFGLLVAPDSGPAFSSFLQRVFAGQEKQSTDLEILRPGEPPRILNISAQWHPGGTECRAAVVDVTERKFAEAVSAQLAAIVNSSSDAIVGKDLEGIVTSWNGGAEKIFGYSAREMVGRSITRIIPSARRSEEAHILGRIRKGEGVEHFDTERVTKDGRMLNVSVTVSPIRNASGKIIGASKVARDVTERKLAEEALRHLAVLTASNRKLELEIAHRREVEESLKESERHQKELLEQSSAMQAQLRSLSRQVIQAQEDERREISRELHDVIAQTLTGINIRLSTLKTEAGVNLRDFERNMVRTQKLVEKSVDVVHQFARELRPAVLDDLGLIPALHSYLKSFTERTGVRAHLKAFSAVEELDTASRTVFFRVAQEALTNVARHAKATRADVDIRKLPDSICMLIHDDGQSFQVTETLKIKGGKRLGLLGMRERVEMVGGTFGIESTPGKGTTVRMEIPLAKISKNTVRKPGKSKLL